MGPQSRLYAVRPDFRWASADRRAGPGKLGIPAPHGPNILSRDLQTKNGGIQLLLAAPGAFGAGDRRGRAAATPMF